MKVPQLTNFQAQDFPTEQKWISPLLGKLNSVLTYMVTAINGNIIYGDNIPCQTQTWAFTYNGPSDAKTIFSWNLPLTPVELRVAQATENNEGIACFVAWQYGNGSVTVNGLYKLTTSGVTPLTVGANYNIVLRGQP